MATNRTISPAAAAMMAAHPTLYIGGEQSSSDALIAERIVGFGPEKEAALWAEFVSVSEWKPGADDPRTGAQRAAWLRVKAAQEIMAEGSWHAPQLKLWEEGKALAAEPHLTQKLAIGEWAFLADQGKAGQSAHDVSYKIREEIGFCPRFLTANVKAAVILERWVAALQDPACWVGVADARWRGRGADPCVWIETGEIKPVCEVTDLALSVHLDDCRPEVVAVVQMEWLQRTGGKRPSDKVWAVQAHNKATAGAKADPVSQFLKGSEDGYCGPEPFPKKGVSADYIRGFWEGKDRRTMEAEVASRSVGDMTE